MAKKKQSTEDVIKELVRESVVETLKDLLIPNKVTQNQDTETGQLGEGAADVADAPSAADRQSEDTDSSDVLSVLSKLAGAIQNKEDAEEQEMNSNESNSELLSTLSEQLKESQSINRMLLGALTGNVKSDYPGKEITIDEAFNQAFGE